MSEQGPIQVDGDNVTIDAATLTIKVDRLVVNASSIEIECSDSLDAEVSTVRLKATSSITLKGLEIDAEAEGKLAMKSGGRVIIKGTTVEIN